MTTDSSVTTTDVPQSPTGPPRQLVFAIVASALFMATVDSTIVATALPAIHRSLHATINWAAWTITIYGLGLVLALPIAGRLSDQLGRRKVFLYGVVLFTVASVSCGFSQNIYMLVIFRALQAFGGGSFIPSSAGIVADHYGANRDRAIGMFGTIASAGQIVGPVLGGLLVGYLSWRWIFFVNAPIGIFVMVAVVKVIPESSRSEGKSTDIRGLSLMGGFIFAAIFGISSLASKSIPLGISIAWEVVAAALLMLFFRHIKNASDPFINPRFLSGRGFAVVNILAVLWGALGFGIATLTPLYAEDRYHLGALNAGTLLTARAIGMIILSAACTLALRRTGYRLPLSVGYLTVAIGTFLTSIGPRMGLGPYVWLSIGAGVMGLGNGMANPASRNASLQLAPDDIPTIAGLRQMFNNIGSIFSVSIVTAILNRTSDPGIVQAHILWIVVGIITFVMVPMVFLVPEHKGKW